MLHKSLAMPFAFALASFCSVLLAPSILLAAAVTGDPLNIGPMSTADSNVVDANSHSAAIGERNSLVGSTHSVAIGYAGKLENSDNSLLAGISNTVSGYAQAVFGESNYVYDGDNLTGGGFNWVYGWANLVAGDSNHLFNTDFATMTAESTAVFGRWNTGDNLMACLISGQNNLIDTAIDSAAIGHGLILDAGSESLVMVGQYNEHGPAAANARFIVASGNETIRSNAFTVYADGRVIIKKRQGDILMGEFGEFGN